MRRSMHSLGNSLIRHAAGWLASFLAVAISLVGRSGEVSLAANRTDLADRDSARDGGAAQISYLQVGGDKGEHEDWWPPKPE